MLYQQRLEPLIKELRLKKGFTQEELADKTGISVRSIQRIENGEVEPRAHSIHKIAEALEVPYTELNKTENEEPSLESGLGWKLAMHTTGLLIFVLPSLLIWFLKKDEIPSIKNHAIVVINFQLNMLALMLLANLFAILIIPILAAIVAVIFYYCIVMLNIVRVAMGQPYYYPIAYPLLKESTL